ncbi:hypothetical protein BD414DRAFT_574923 [Trametes punicea]|nr:hypothetical protein BD414DRAFT_574923 [Trametes punicea]
MSLSTGSCCSFESCVRSSDVRRDSQAVKQGWAKELEDRVLLFPGSVTEFIDELLPCSVPFEDDDPAYVDGGFANYNPVVDQEMKECSYLLAGLRRLVESFPDDRKVEIADTRSVKMRFPFEAFQKRHHETSPDLSVSFPGKPLSPKTWEGISMVFEAKGSESEDPFPRDGGRHTRTVEQIAKNGRNLLLAHGFLCAFAVGVYGRTLRIVRFDHSYALVTAPFSLGEGGALLIKKFLWHFSGVGEDTVGEGKAEDWEKHFGQLHEGRRVEVYGQEPGRCVPYLLYHLVDVNGRLFSRVTMVWHAIEDTRIWKDGRLVPDPTCTVAVNPRIVKEAWRQLARTAEPKFYERLNTKILVERRFGLAKMAHGGDVGAFEYQWWERTLEQNGTNATGKGAPDSDPSAISGTGDGPRLFGSSVFFCSTGSTGPNARPFVRSTVDHMPNFDFPLPHPRQQTYSWRLHGEEFWHSERSHMRMVIDDVGRPLTEFRSTRELVTAIRDAIRGMFHPRSSITFTLTCILVGNILISDDPSEVSHVGFLHDFDYSSITTDSESRDDRGMYSDIDMMDKPTPMAVEDEASRFKERTGTYFFMARALLFQSPNTIHDPCLDLESFYWVLLWVVLRHTDCRRKVPLASGQEVCKQLFGCTDDQRSHAQKFTFIGTAAVPDFGIDVHGNSPLTTLLLKFVQLVNQISLQRAHPTVREISSMYENVLAAFDEALRMEGWPEEDWIPCTLLDDKDPQTGTAPILADVPPGYEDHSEGRRLRSHSSRSLSVALQDGGQAGPSTSRAHRSTSAALAAEAGFRPRSASKRLYDHDDRSAATREASHARKRSKKTEMEPPPHPAADPAATPAGQTTSRGPKSQPHSESRVSRPPTRSSSRTKTQLAKKACKSDPSI